MQTETRVAEDDLVGIDIRRAYTAELLQVTKVPVFNEFDKFVPYDGHEHEKRIRCTLSELKCSMHVSIRRIHSYVASLCVSSYALSFQ